jgi:magnesium-protoporphyrin IX monomethyl ester (oxidative) cyclase
MGRYVGDQAVPTLRVKSADRLVEEIRVLVRRFDRRYLGWVDPCFNADPRVPGKLGERLLHEGIRIGQAAWMRTDALVRDATSGALKNCVRSGLNEVYLGIERPDEESLEALGKTSGVNQARCAMDLLRERFPEVLALGSFIYGLPGDTPASIRAIHRLAIDLDLDQFFFIPLTPLPGTKDWRPELWDPSGERFREFNFLPSGRPHGRHQALERALILSLLFNWFPARVGTYARRLFNPDPRKRRVSWRLIGRGAAFQLRQLGRLLWGGARDCGMVFPAWYEN